MTVSDKYERENIASNAPVEDQSNSRGQPTLSARRTGTVGHISVQIPSPKITMDYHTTDVEFDSGHSYWVEAWLDEHPEFFQAYLIRKGTRSMIDSWLVTHALPPGVTATTLHNVDEEELDDLDTNISGGDGINESTAGSGNISTVNNTESVKGASSIPIPTGAITTGSGSKFSGGSKCSSGSGTPVRKISAHEFERGGLTKPLVITVDGTPTFLSPPISSDVTGQIRKKSRNDVQGLNETDLIFELVKDICNDLDIQSLCHKILQNVGILTSADRCSLFLVQGEPGSDSRFLVSNLFDVSSKSTVEEMNQKAEIRIPWGQGIVGYVAESGMSLNIADCYADSRFNQEVDVMTGYKTRSMMCHPIKDGSSDILGVAQVINKSGGDASFSQNDENVFRKYLQFCGIGLRNAQLYERSQLEVRRNQVLLDLAGVIFQEQSTIDNMIDRILTHMLSLIRCERAILLLLHETSQGTFSRVFELDSTELEEMDRNSDQIGEESGDVPNKPSGVTGQPNISPVRKRPREGRFPVNPGITGYVAATGETINIPNAYEDDRFDPMVDEKGEFKHRTILCMPIMHSNKPNRVLGLFQLVNKFDNLPFTKNDENFVQAFAIFCGMGISNVRMYEKTCLVMAKQQVTLEVLSYHATAPADEALKLTRQKIPSAAALQLKSLAFDDFGLQTDETLQAALRMFIDMDFTGRFHIEYNVLCRWLVSVRKNYRSVAYHNWRHAFNVAQMMFAILHNTQWWKKIGELECLSLIIACLCHDLDHRGTNNAFQIKSHSNLSYLYSTSTMEHHHFDQCLMILNSKGNQILGNLSQEEFKRVIHVLEDAILATDLAVYFQRRGETFSKMNSRSLDLNNPANHSNHDRSLFRGLLMTACDLGAITKPWPIQKKVARLVAHEFFEQGDMEKNELNLEPIDMMNREKLDSLPKMQVGFIDSICLPIYEAFSNYSDDQLHPMLDGCLENKKEWLKLAENEKFDAWENDEKKKDSA